MKDERVKCYGVECPKCHHPCELQAAGIDRYNDDWSDRRIAREGGMHNVFLRASVPDMSTAAPDLCADPDAGTEASPSKRDLQREIVLHLAELYFRRPATFDMMMRRAFFDENQSDIARHKGVTRAAVSKAIREENNRRLKSENAALRQRCDDLVRMTRAEAAVYKVCAVDGVLSVSEAARQTGFTRRTIYRSIQVLSEKYGISIHTSPGDNKKIAKKLTAPAKSGERTTARLQGEKE